ncbi:MAG: hypothetical protein PF542_03340 [Nanoarchaeota archaeon]|jgi:hypothetical protein|nr:hypothetical protein [Nanoarchaeota archaeon]
MGRVVRLGLFVLLLVLLPIVSAADFDYVITNSEKWTDVYSGLHYANLEGVQSDFLVSVPHGKILLNSIGKSKTIRVVSSRDAAYVFDYPNLIKDNGFSGADEIVSRNLNIDLLKELDGITNFIFVDDSYGYSAIAVVPYAVKTNSWVFFGNKYTIDEIKAVLSQRTVDNVLIYGYVDREVRDALEEYSPEVINHQDKFEDNIEIVKKFLELSPQKQVLLTNGEFIEKELMIGTQPILFTGRENVPDQIRDYLKSSDIEIGVLIGNELLGAATNIRRSAAISVMVKFARGARTPGEGVAAVEGLDLFPLPTPVLKLEIYSVEYNKMTNQLEVTYKSASNTQAYLKGTITIRDNGERITLGDAEAIFVSPGSYKTLTYDVQLDSYDGLVAEIFTLYGESKTSLDRAIDAEVEISVVDIIDDCEIDVSKVVYNKQKGQFQVVVKNIADVACWVDLSLDDVLIGYEERTLASDRAERIAPGKDFTFLISEDMADGDLEDNTFVDLTARYGEKETGLVKIFTGRFELRVSTLSTVTYTMIGAASAGLIFFFLFALRRRKEKEFDF